MIGFPRVSWPAVEDDLAAHGPGLGVPVGRVGQVADQLELVYAVQVGEHLLGVAQEVGEDVVVVPYTL